MRPSPGLLVLTALGAGCNSPGPGNAIEAVVEVGANVQADCLEVAVWSQPGQELHRDFKRTSATQYTVAIFPGNGLSASVTVMARGFIGAECTQMSAASAQTGSAFAPNPPLVTLVLQPLGPTGDAGAGDAGAQADAGPGDAGAQSDGGPGDAGTGDAGSADAGPADAGTGDGGCDGADAGQACGFGWGLCATDATCVQNFPFPPSNFGPPYPPISPGITLGCQAVLDTTAPGLPPVFQSWCGQPIPGWKDAPQVGGPPAVVLAMSSLSIPGAGRLSVDGGRPVIFAIFGDATLSGTVFAGAVGRVTGAGAAPSESCGDGQGGGGPSIAGGRPGAGGGGGGGFGTLGASGGAGNTGASSSGAAGAGGADAGSANNQPLRSGCGGGDGGPTAGGTAGSGGGGGGAIQFTAANLLTVTGTVSVPGGGGAGGGGGAANGGNPGAGAAGGGSGGAILLEASNLSLNGANLTANGGGGGGGGDDNHTGAPGSDGVTNSSAAAKGGPAQGSGGNGGNGGSNADPTPAMPGNNDWGSGGGGGGAVGRIWLRGADGGCSINGGVISPPATSNGAPGCP